MMGLLLRSGHQENQDGAMQARKRRHCFGTATNEVTQNPDMCNEVMVPSISRGSVQRRRLLGRTHVAKGELAVQGLLRVCLHNIH